MAESRDKPELETLSYRNPGMPKPLKRGFMGLNANIIKPETRRNSSEVAEQPKECNCKDRMHLEGAILCPDCVEQPKDVCRHCGACRIVRPSGEWQFNCRCYEDDKLYLTEQPNQNLMIIEEIEGLISQANEKLDILNRNTYMLPCQQPILISTALEEIDLFQKTTLFELRRAFE